MKFSGVAQSAERFPYKEEVTGSNPVAPKRVFRNHIYVAQPNKNRKNY